MLTTNTYLSFLQHFYLRNGNLNVTGETGSQQVTIPHKQ